MATVGTIVANLVANTTKFNQAMKKSRNEVRQLREETNLLGKASAGAGLLGKGLGIRGGIGAAGAAMALTRLLPAEVRNLPNEAFTLASEKIASAFGLVTERMREFSKTVHDVQQSIVANERKRPAGPAGPLGRLRDTQGKLFGRDLNPEDQPLFGGRLGFAGDRFQRSELFRRGISQGFQERKKILGDLSIESQNSVRARLVSAAVTRITRARQEAGETGRISAGEMASIRASAQRQLDQRNAGLERSLNRNVQETNELIVRQRRERQARIGLDVATGFAGSLRQAPGALGNLLGGNQQLNAFRDGVSETFGKLTDATRRWKAEVEAAAAAAKELNRGNIGQFRDSIKLLFAAKGVTNEERRAGLLRAFEELKDKTGLTGIGDASGPLKGSNEALNEILRVTRENPTEKQVLDVAEAQLEEQKQMAEKLARELERLGVAGIRQANF
jgi:hypothetical protein